MVVKLPRPLQTSLKVVAIAFVSLSIGWAITRHLTELPVTKWKALAIERLTQQSLTNAQLRAELEEIKTSDKTNDIHRAWTNTNLLHMANGEIIIYEYRHGRNDHFPRHLLIGRSSSGQWLYSRYHFCNSMTMVAFDKPPASIAQFSERYRAYPFNGKPDDIP